MSRTFNFLLQIFADLMKWNHVNQIKWLGCRNLQEQIEKICLSLWILQNLDPTYEKVQVFGKEF